MAKEISFSDKKYYSISEVSELCSVKPHTLRFWENEFKDLKPITRKGNRRYYQKKDIEMIEKIQSLLYIEELESFLLSQYLLFDNNAYFLFL